MAVTARGTQGAVVDSLPGRYPLVTGRAELTGAVSRQNLVGDPHTAERARASGARAAAVPGPTGGSHA
ncbi:hypothetical protein GXW82_16090 [Streptacidiphilus sp. 4-A2]|nr:hypothetical protein [Streptacidiphilus sp. 4-A2]